MGVRYIQTKADKVPAGYKTLLEKDGHILAENSNVLPIAYGSTALISEPLTNFPIRRPWIPLLTARLCRIL